MCDISNDVIDQESFDCSDPSSLHVTYRARLSGTPKTDSRVFISHIEKWVLGGPNVRVQGILMRIDHDCQVSIESFNDGLCTDAPMTTIESEIPTTVETDTPTTPDNDNSTTVETNTATTPESDSPTTASPSSQSYSAMIIGGVIAVILIIAVSIVIIVLALIRKSRHGELSIKKPEE